MLETPKEASRLELDEFYDLTEFAVEIEYAPRDGHPALVIPAILDPEDYEAANEFIEGERVLRIRADDDQGITDPVVGDRITIEGQSSIVKQLRSVNDCLEWIVVVDLGCNTWQP